MMGHTRGGRLNQEQSWGGKRPCMGKSGKKQTVRECRFAHRVGGSVSPLMMPGGTEARAMPAFLSPPSLYWVILEKLRRDMKFSQNPPKTVFEGVTLGRPKTMALKMAFMSTPPPLLPLVVA